MAGSGAPLAGRNLSVAISARHAGIRPYSALPEFILRGVVADAVVSLCDNRNLAGYW